MIHGQKGMAACAALLAWFAAGCATIFTGTSDTLKFDSNVPGVHLSIDGRVQGELPLTVDVSRNFVGGKKFIARFEKEGYETQEFPLAQQFNAVAILDLSSPLTSGGVDVLTGALFKFSPREYHVQMLADGRTTSSAAFRRSLELHQFALTNYRRLQTDLARGAGETLDALVFRTADGDAAVARLIEQESRTRALELVAEKSAPAFVGRFKQMLADTPALQRYRFE